jgi:hypothetical protein
MVLNKKFVNALSMLKDHKGEKLSFLILSNKCLWMVRKG